MLVIERFCAEPGLFRPAICDLWANASVLGIPVTESTLPRHAPVPLGSTRDVTLHTTLAIVTDVCFAAGTELPEHSHERTIFGVMLGGAFQSRIRRRELDCRVGSAWTEPLGERHANVVGCDGAHVLAIQPDPQRAEMLDGLRPMLEDVHMMHGAGLRADALRVSRELQSPDALTALSVDALVMQIFVASARLEFGRGHHGKAPRWLLTVRDALHSTFASPPRLDQLANDVGVSASHLAHAFKRHFGIAPGDYARRARADWAIEQLTSTARTIAEIAHDAGYSDQSHLTRDVRRKCGKTPAALRIEHRAAVE